MKTKKTRGTKSSAPKATRHPYRDLSLLNDVKQLISRAHQVTASAVNSALVLLYWRVGDRIHREILSSKRAQYGEHILATLSAQLIPEFGQGFGQRNLQRMVRFVQVFPDSKIASTLSTQLGWSHFVEILTIKDQVKREFYAEMCRIERWSVRTLRVKISGMLFERTTLSKKPHRLITLELRSLRERDTLTPELVFRDPYFLDFLGLKDTYNERDLEGAILADLQKFILEIGNGFTFVARQKRITIEKKDYYLDLLFYHRDLRRLIAIELKLGAFQAADKGQMELYLRWLEKFEMKDHEDRPLGLILCEDKGTEQLELLQLNESGIHVSSYLTKLLPRRVLLKKLREAIKTARNEIK